MLLGFYQKNDLEIKHDLPEALKPGEEKLVTFDINKSDVTGFAKFQIELDPGLRAEMVQSDGASFTFNNQTVKFIWMALPSAKQIQLKIRLIADENAGGNLEAKSRFSYIYENERKNFDVNPHFIAVGTADDMAANSIKESLEARAKNMKAIAAAHRTVSPAGVNQWRVDIDIDKSMLQGFAKVEEIVPDGYTVIDLKSSSAVFSIDDTQIKYIWFDIPENDVVTISYKMLPVIATDNVKPQIRGNFSFLKDEETITIPILDRDEAEIAALPKDTLPAEVVDSTPAEEPELASTETPEETETPEKTDIPEKKAPGTTTPEPDVAEAKPPVPEEKPAAPVQEKAEAKPETKPVQTAQPKQRETTTANRGLTDGNIVDIPQPETGVFYRVQIAAGKNNLNRDIFAKLYKFDEGFKLESASGLLKYTTGYHQVYKAARDDRERITAKYDKFKGPFVAAYNDGDRITVQEALMITSQKWFQ